MSAIKKEELEKLEKEYNLTPDGLSYQHRCSRITAIMKGEAWVKPEKTAKQKVEPVTLKIEEHPLYGKRILLTPLMVPDAKRNLAYDEELGPEIEVEEFNAGESIHGQPEDVDRMAGDYKIIRTNPHRKVIAKTTFPKIGTEISWRIGYDLVPVVRGNSGERGYIWSFPNKLIQVEDTILSVYGLKTLIQGTFPELLEEFKGKPMMSYIDGVTLAANIPLTEALLKKRARKELIDARAGIEY